jgi:hypothetical protein
MGATERRFLQCRLSAGRDQKIVYLPFFMKKEFGAVLADGAVAIFRT